MTALQASGMLLIYLLEIGVKLLIGVGVLALVVPVVADYLWRINLLKRRTR